jgi:hypothetical protein
MLFPNHTSRTELGRASHADKRGGALLRVRSQDGVCSQCSQPLKTGGGLGVTSRHVRRWGITDLHNWGAMQVDCGCKFSHYQQWMFIYCYLTHSSFHSFSRQFLVRDCSDDRTVTQQVQVAASELSEPTLLYYTSSHFRKLGLLSPSCWDQKPQCDLGISCLYLHTQSISMSSWCCL